MTDEEIANALENCLNGNYKTKCNGCPYDKSKGFCQDMDRDVLKLIRCLQKENEDLQKENERLKKFERYRIKKMKEQKAEIERMAGERETANKQDLMYWFKAYGECAEDCANYACENGAIQAKNSELQKQVDELTDKLGKVLSGIKADELLVAKGIEQAIKETAKEILTIVGNISEDSDIGVKLKNYRWFQNLCKNYNVEVEE